jgi:hypothetical protein
MKSYKGMPLIGEQLKEGFKAWLQTAMFKNSLFKTVPVPKNTQAIVVAD